MSELSDKIEKTYFNLILTPKLQDPLRHLQTRSFLQSRLDEINELRKVCGKLHLLDDFLLQYLIIEMGIVSKKYHISLRAASRQLYLYHTSKVNHHPHKLLNIYSNVSQIHIYAGDTTGAKKYLGKALKLSDPKKDNYLLCHDLAFLNEFYSENLPSAARHLEICLKAPESHGMFRLSKYRYHAACLEFVKKDYKEALKHFSQQFDFQQDKMGYAIWLRIMQILCLVETGEIPAAISKVGVLERQFLRLRKKEPLPERTTLVIKLLINLGKTGFRPSRLRKTTLRSLQLLGEKKQNWSWQPFTPELVKFHEWVRKM
ncbi:MAG: hypothetical protein IT233_04500 [Bacteroidia bacterium]|nr:hypothetical protein [Bacteroidia bacterium]